MLWKHLIFSPIIYRLMEEFFIIILFVLSINRQSPRPIGYDIISCIGQGDYFLNRLKLNRCTLGFLRILIKGKTACKMQLRDCLLEIHIYTWKLILLQFYFVRSTQSSCWQFKTSQILSITSTGGCFAVFVQIADIVGGLIPVFIASSFCGMN